MFIIFTETLRKYPFLTSINRSAKTDYKVANTNQVIEQGTWIKVPIYGIHYDPDYYPKPDVFDPERFSDSEIKKRHAMTWLPFGSGPRGCIGIRFATMQMQAGLACLLSNFEVSVCSKTIESIVFHPKRAFLSPKDDIFLKFTPLDVKLTSNTNAECDE